MAGKKRPREAPASDEDVHENNKGSRSRRNVATVRRVVAVLVLLAGLCVSVAVLGNEGQNVSKLTME
jgi:hypothetical protein